jgi:methylated-DNA-[protein]-cysteine S-methyltransferase
VKETNAYYHIFPTAFGNGAVVFQQGRHPVKRILLPGFEKTTPDACHVAPSFLHTNPPRDICALIGDIQAYFRGKPIETPWPLLDLDAITRLQKKVLQAVSSIPHGETRTYGDVASSIGRPRAFRFVGTTLRKNPFPVIIPCHRVIRTDGSPGAFAGGIEGTLLKSRLIMLEKTSSQVVQTRKMRIIDGGKHEPTG